MEKAYFQDTSGLNRIAALSDGVFSIVMTLLVFDLKIPPDVMAPQLTDAFFKLGPRFLSYILTFFLIGIYWIGHHAIMRHLIRYDRHFLWLNIIFLMCVGFLPFPTSILGAYPDVQLAIVLYGMSLVATGVALSFLWGHSTRGHRLVDPHLSQSVIKFGHRRIITAPTLAALSILLSFVSLRLSIWLYIIGGILYCLPTRIDREIAQATRHEFSSE